VKAESDFLRDNETRSAADTRIHARERDASLHRGELTHARAYAGE